MKQTGTYDSHYIDGMMENLILMSVLEFINKERGIVLECQRMLREDDPNFYGKDSNE